MTTEHKKNVDDGADGPALLSVTAAARQCGIGRTLAYRWLSTGVLRSTKIGGRRLVDAISVREIRDRCHAGLGEGEQ